MSTAIPSSDSRDRLTQWIDGAHAGDGESLGKLLESLRPLLLAMAQEELDPSLQAKAGASDIVQDTYLEAQRDFGHFRGQTREELQAWMRRILRNNLLNFVRSYRETAMRDQRREVSFDHDSGHGPVRDRLVIDNPSPRGQAIHAEQVRRLQAGLERLPEEQRHVLLLRYVEKLEFPEIGTAIGKSAEAARKIWFRGVDRLRHEMGF